MMVVPASSVVDNCYIIYNVNYVYTSTLMSNILETSV